MGLKFQSLNLLCTEKPYKEERNNYQSGLKDEYAIIVNDKLALKGQEEIAKAQNY